MENEFKGIPKSLKKQMYDSYCFNMKMFDKPILPYKEWLKEVYNVELNQTQNESIIS